jgi:hypothetical protein
MTLLLLALIAFLAAAGIAARGARPTPTTRRSHR